MKKLILFFSLVLMVSFTYAQRTVTGTVKDVGGSPLVGANVTVEGSNTGTSADIDGKFSISVPDGKNTLVVSFVGFTSQDVDITGKSNVDVVLVEGQFIDEIIVTGQGAGISKRRLSTTVDVLDSETIDKLPSQQLDQLLQSNTPGAQVRLSSGQPGTAAIVRTRGPISANSSATPVIIVDGIRVDNLNSNPELGANTGGANVSALADIPVESIEKIEYIKGGAATTLYGADAANGVIQIITKKGKDGKVTPFVEFRVGSITAEDKWLAYERTGEAIFEPGLLSEFKAGLSGGTKAFSYNFVGSMYQDDGFNDLNEQLKRSFNFGFTSQLGDRWTYSGSVALTNFNYNLDYNANTSFSRFSAAEGGAFGDIDALSDEDWDVLKEDIAARGELSNIQQDINRISASNRLTYKIQDNWNTNVTFGVENRRSRQQELGTNAFQIQLGAIAPGTTDQAFQERYLRDVTTTTFDWNTVHTHETGDLSFITTAGARFFRTTDYQEALILSGGIDGTTTASFFGTQIADDFVLESANFGLYFLENIGYKNKLFLEFGGTLDQNTNAGENASAQFLPKVGATYNTEEINDIVSNVRVRANYGVATNFAQPFAEQRTFAVNSFLGQSGFAFANPGDPDLVSERVQTAEIGVDIDLFNYRAKLGVTRYNGKTVDALFTPPSIPSSGQLDQVTNIGVIRNKGWELSATVDIIRNDDHNLKIRGAYNTNNNTIEDAGGSPAFNVGGFLVVGSWIEEGQSLGYLRATDAVLQEDGSYEFVDNANLGSTFAPRFGSIGLDYTFKNKLTVFATSDFQFGGTNVDLSLLLRYLRGVAPDAVPEELQSNSFFDLPSFFADKSDFYKVRNIGINYNLGETVKGKIRGLQNIRLGLTLTNPFSWTAADFDPEVTGSGIGAQNGFSSGGFAYGTESAPRQIIGSIKFQF